MKLHLWMKGSPGHKAEVLLNEIWHSTRRPYSRTEERIYSRIQDHVIDHLLDRFSSQLSREQASQIASECTLKFRARLHLRHLPGNAMPPESFFSTLDDCAFKLLCRSRNPIEANLADRDADEALVGYLFGEGVTIDLYEEAVGSLQMEGRHVDFRIILEYVDQYDASAPTMRDRIRPTCESVARALQTSEISAHEVRDSLRRFEYDLAWRLAKARPG